MIYEQTNPKHKWSELNISFCSNLFKYCKIKPLDFISGIIILQPEVDNIIEK